MLKVAKATPSFFSSQSTFLNKLLAPATRPYSSVAFNVKSKFENAFHKKREAASQQTKKQYSFPSLLIHFF